MNKKTAKHIVFAVLMFAVTLAAAKDDYYRFYTPVKDGVLFLAEVNSKEKGCEGKRDASEQKQVLGKWVLLRTLCYEVDKAGDIVVTDPSKMRFFNTYKVKANLFISIEDERAAEAERMRAEIYRRQNQLFSDIEKSRQAPQQREPLSCIDIGGGIISCF